MDENEKTEGIELKTIELIVTECDDPKPSSTSAPNLESKKGSWLDLSQNQSIVSLRSGFLVFLYRRCSQKGADWESVKYSPKARKKQSVTSTAKSVINKVQSIWDGRLFKFVDLPEWMKDNEYITGRLEIFGHFDFQKIFFRFLNFFFWIFFRIFATVLKICIGHRSKTWNRAWSLSSRFTRKLGTFGRIWLAHWFFLVLLFGTVFAIVMIFSSQLKRRPSLSSFTAALSYALGKLGLILTVWFPFAFGCNIVLL